VAMLKQNFPESDAFNEQGEFESDILNSEDRSLASVVTFGLMGDE
jgi:outer membrane protein assembly factor BamD